MGTFDSSSGYCYGWEFPNDVVLCLNGHNIIMDNPVDTTDEICVILVDHHFTLTDCHAGSQQGKITHASGKNGNGVKVVGGTFDMYGGIITGNTSKNDIGGAGVSVRGVNNAGTTTKFRMYGGEISGNKAKSGGGVYVTRGIYSNGPAEFYMYGGSIKNNIADSDTSTSCRGGGVYLGWTSKFIMSGGTISGNTAGQYGGGVYAAALAKEYVSSSSGSATIEISNKATVTGNSAAGESNNICLDSDKTSIDAISAKITITDVFTGTIGISTTTPPTSGNPVAIDAV